MTKPDHPSVAIVLLAAGQAKRMGGEHHKLLAEFDGVPLVRRMAQMALAAKPHGLIVVTGYRHEDIAACLAGLPLEIVLNQDFASGMASSIVAGIRLPIAAKADGVMILLADMPGVTGAELQLLIDAFVAAEGKAVVRAVSNGKRGNPVILPRSLHGRILQLTGDVGARQIIETCGLEVIDVEIGAAAHVDVDTIESVVAAGGVLKG